MDEIVASFGRATGIVRGIALDRGEQPAGIEQINEAVGPMGSGCSSWRTKRALDQRRPRPSRGGHRYPFGLA
jgi:hypothetical protein